MWEKYDKKLPSEHVLERKRFHFFDRTFLLQEADMFKAQEDI